MNMQQQQQELVRTWAAESFQNARDAAQAKSDRKFEKQMEIRDHYLRNGFALEVANVRSCRDIQSFII